jgi:hypothetical protein
MTYVPPSQRHRRSSGSSKKGPVIFCCILLLIIAFAVFVIYENRQPEPTPSQATTEKLTAPTRADTSYQDRNTRRQKDARAVWYGGGNFFRANTVDSKSVYPTGYSAGAFTGPAGTKPQPATLLYYTTVKVVSGAQPAVTTDKIQFVYNANCGPTEGKAVADNQAYGYAVQYSIEDAAGKLSPMCLRL